MRQLYANKQICGTTKKKSTPDRLYILIFAFGGKLAKSTYQDRFLPKNYSGSATTSIFTP
jgi:hypothetical protein